ncbi:hypothetical protein [Levilactobacillus tujiorum]|uniref:hypothetical protein n=1 Tax=Levilactobacillus tujiorum TaxID=2912243 RepID=UPI0014570865|nr:hypothetical protein [Levilactobacillus tujiorum]NLR30938.1 hypothetical protein [Levilactobacillus tujiorum]
MTHSEIQELQKECPLPIDVQDETPFVKVTERVTPEEGAREIADILSIPYEQALAEIRSDIKLGKIKR